MDINDISTYDFFLPEVLIAQKPHDPVDQCKVLKISRESGQIIHDVFDNVCSLLHDSSVVFFNNSKVIPARIKLNDVAIKNSGVSLNINNGELFYLSTRSNGLHEFLVKPGSKFKIGSSCIIHGLTFKIVGDREYGRLIECDGDILEFLSEYGEMPLPPYIEYNKSKDHLYQPVFAKKSGSVASPTASLHFTTGLLKNMKNNGVNFEYVTLHVGIGTFRTIKERDISKYSIHSELCEVDISVFSKIAEYKKIGKSIIAVGTTACRTLESLVYLWSLLDEMIINGFDEHTKEFWCKQSDSANNYANYVTIIQISENSIQFQCTLYITPGFRFTVVDQLITNFHLPKSSLIILVSSFLGIEYTKKAYQEAIDNNYMFYSFGDAMWIY